MLGSAYIHTNSGTPGIEAARLKPDLSPKATEFSQPNRIYATKLETLVPIENGSMDAWVAVHAHTLEPR